MEDEEDEYFDAISTGAIIDTELVGLDATPFPVNHSANWSSSSAQQSVTSGIVTMATKQSENQQRSAALGGNASTVSTGNIRRVLTSNETEYDLAQEPTSARNEVEYDIAIEPSNTQNLVEYDFAREPAGVENTTEYGMAQEPSCDENRKSAVANRVAMFEHKTANPASETVSGNNDSNGNANTVAEYSFGKPFPEDRSSGFVGEEETVQGDGVRYSIEKDIRGYSHVTKLPAVKTPPVVVSNTGPFVVGSGADSDKTVQPKVPGSPGAGDHLTAIPEPDDVPERVDLEGTIYDSVCDDSASSREVSGSYAGFEIVGGKKYDLTSKMLPLGGQSKVGSEEKIKHSREQGSRKFRDSEYEWKRRRATKTKSMAGHKTNKEGSPFTQHSQLNDPHRGAMPEADTGDGLMEVFSPFNMGEGSDSNNSWSTDSTFDSSDSDESGDPNNQFARQISYPKKPLPEEPVKGQKKITEKEEDMHSRPMIQTVDTKTPRPEPALPLGPHIPSPTQIKQRGVLQSLIDSEKNYIRSLERLVNEYQGPIINQFGIRKIEVEVTFKRVRDLLNIHKMFQIELSEKLSKWYQDERIGSIFTFFSREMVLDCYSDYVNNYETASEILKEVETTKQGFKDFLKQKQMSSSDRLSLPGLMLKPIQRFPQFILIIKDLLKTMPPDHHDREAQQEGLTELENVAHQLNERKRQCEQYFHGQQIVARLAPRLHVDRHVFLIRQDDMDQLTQDPNGGHSIKKRRLYLMNNKLVSVLINQRDADGMGGERVTYKWHQNLKNMELTLSAITPNMHTQIHTDKPNNTTILSPVIDMKDEDPYSVATELTEMLHDISVLAKISHLVSTLKLTYPGLSEDELHGITTNLQKAIQGKDYQLQMLNSSSIILEDKARNKKYVFSAANSRVKQEWCIDFLLAKHALDVVNIPSWHSQEASSSHRKDPMTQPALLMKHMSVDMQRTFTRVRCAASVYFPTRSSGSVEHLWVCSSTETVGQVSLVSLHTAKPALTESFQATQAEIVCVETVPGFALMADGAAFEMDTVWMSTVDSEILVFELSEMHTTQHRRAKHTFKPGCFVITMMYIDDHVFCGSRGGTVVVYTRNDDGRWRQGSSIKLGSGTVTSMLCVRGALWVACGSHMYILDPETCMLQDKVDHQNTGQHVNLLVKAGVGVWASFLGCPSISLYHSESKRFLQELSICNAINEFISVYSGIKEMSKNYEVTSLMASLGLLWVGTSVGVILTYPLPRLRDGVPRINHRPQVALHGHNGPIRFILPVQYGPVSGVPIRRRPSSILMGNRVDNSIIHGLPKLQEENKYTSLDGETMMVDFYGEENIYEEVKYGSREGLDTIGGDVSNKDNVEASDSKVTEVTGGRDSPVSAQESELYKSDEHKYFVLEPHRRSGDKTELPEEHSNTESKTTEASNNLSKDSDINHKPVSPGSVPKKQEIESNSTESDVLLRKACSSPKGRPLTLGDELKMKLKKRRSLDDLLDEKEELDVLYPTLMRHSAFVPSQENSSFVTSLPKDFVSRDHDEQIYHRTNFHTPIKTKKPDMTSTRPSISRSLRHKSKEKDKTPSTSRPSSEVSKSKSSAKVHYETNVTKVTRVGSSFSGSKGIDTLRKQDTNTILVLSGGDGVKDWKKRQSLQYRPEEPCLMFWMYKF